MDLSSVSGSQLSELFSASENQEQTGRVRDYWNRHYGSRDHCLYVERERRYLPSDGKTADRDDITFDSGGSFWESDYGTSCYWQ